MSSTLFGHVNYIGEWNSSSEDFISVPENGCKLCFLAIKLDMKKVYGMLD